jgi:hypothetical protein
MKQHIVAALAAVVISSGLISLSASGQRWLPVRVGRQE